MVTYVVIAVLAAAVGVLAYVVYHQARTAVDPGAEEAERQMAEPTLTTSSFSGLAGVDTAPSRHVWMRARNWQPVYSLRSAAVAPAQPALAFLR